MSDVLRVYWLKIGRDRAISCVSCKAAYDGRLVITVTQMTRMVR